jgi:hypothetical protein
MARLEASKSSQRRIQELAANISDAVMKTRGTLTHTEVAAALAIVAVALCPTIEPKL